MSNGPKMYHITILGNENVGKSSIILSYSTEKPNICRTSTIGARYTFKTLYLGQTETRIKICDTSGGKSYVDLVQKYYTNCDAALLVYDIHNRESYEAVKRWVIDLRKKLSSYQPKIVALAGNKCDIEDNRMISTEEAEIYAKENDLIFMETSAITNDNVKNIFETIVYQLNLEYGSQQVATKDQKKRKGHCCLIL